MSEVNDKTSEGAALWQRARGSWSPARDNEAPDPLLVAAWLDGRLDEDEAARLEARLAGDPASLGDMLALREGLASGAEAAPAGVVERAQALRLRGQRQAAPARAAAVAGPSLLDRLFGFSLRPALAGLALLLACAGALELGRYQAQQLDSTTQTAESGDSEVPVDLLMGGLL